MYVHCTSLLDMIKSCCIVLHAGTGKTQNTTAKPQDTTSDVPLTELYAQVDKSKKTNKPAEPEPVVYAQVNKPKKPPAPEKPSKPAKPARAKQTDDAKV